MRGIDPSKRAYQIVLYVSLVAAIATFGVPHSYSLVAHWAIAVVEMSAVAYAAALLARRTSGPDWEERQLFALAGTLLIAPIALFPLLAGFGPPEFAQVEQNRLRYLILLIGIMLVASGFRMLREALARAGSSVSSTLGSAAIALATPLYLIWAAILLGAYLSFDGTRPAHAAPWVEWLVDMSDILLFFGGIFTYAATAAFAFALGKVGVVGRTASRMYVAVSLIAASLLAARGLAFHDTSMAFAHWYTIVEWVAGIPAVPWIMPYLLGVSLLGRAGVSRAAPDPV